MDSNPSIESTGYVDNTCKNCQKKVFPTDRFCTACGFPMNATEEEENQFYYRIGAKKLQLEELDRKIRNAKTTLYVIAGFMFVVGLIIYLTSRDNDLALAIFLSNVIVAVIFVLLAELSKQRPFIALLSGLLLYITLNLYMIVIEGASPFSGIIIKGIIIVYLVKGINSAREAEQIKKEIDG